MHILVLFFPTCFKLKKKKVFKADMIGESHDLMASVEQVLGAQCSSFRLC